MMVLDGCPLIRNVDEQRGRGPLSNRRNYRPDYDQSSLPPRRRATTLLETAIATFKADLTALGVCRTPPIDDVDGWQRAVPKLKALMSLGALSDARNDDWTS